MVYILTSFVPPPSADIEVQKGRRGKADEDLLKRILSSGWWCREPKKEKIHLLSILLLSKRCLPMLRFITSVAKAPLARGFNGCSENYLLLIFNEKTNNRNYRTWKNGRESCPAGIGKGL